jgi:hypothetical protein
MKKIPYIIIILFLSYQWAFAEGSKIDYKTLSSWYKEANLAFKNGDIVRAYKYYSALVLADWGKGDKRYNEVRNHIRKRLTECEMRLDLALRRAGLVHERDERRVGAPGP